MNQGRKTVRVFISSTFRDMHAERDHLVTVVFPELRERVEQLGMEFFDVDLRWGVPAKDANGETANSWEYCRQWIDRVEPFFVCILGQRYGWVPEPRHFRDTTDRQRQERDPRSITDMEVRHAVLDSHRKRRSYFYLRTTQVPEPNTEYVDPPEYQDRLTQLKTDVRQCGRPVHDYHPEWTGECFTGLEEFGRLVLEDLWSGVLRDERYVRKEDWRQVLNADPDTDPRYTDESQPVPRELWEKIVAKARPVPVSPLDAERQQMEAFAASRLRWFQGRTNELQQLTEFVYSTGADVPRLAVVAAEPGQGKSALLAKLSTLLVEPSTFLITHFIGATERSATAYALVERLLDELDRSGMEWPANEQNEGEELKRDFNSQCHRLAKRLGEYAGEKQVVILLDALNQLTDGHDLVWLPHRLGPSVRVVVSCVDDPTAKADSPEHCVMQALASRQPISLQLPLGPLTEADVRTIVIDYLKEYCKELDREHVDAICHMEQTRNPLYLLVMLGELRTLGGNDMNRVVGERITALPHDFPYTVALFRWVLQRLEVFGVEAVRWWCLYLAHGRVGMASHELADLLARKLDANAAATALLIERGLRRYLLQRGGQLDFFHGQLRQAVMEQYGSHAESAMVHQELADYFTACAKGTDLHKEWETDSVRGFSECVFHLTKAGQHEHTAELLTAFPFLLHKLRVGLLEGVFEDYDMVRREAPAQVAKRLEIWADFFREKAHLLREGDQEWPAHKILLQLAIEHADDSPITLGSEQWLKEDRCDWLWLRRTRRVQHAEKNPCMLVLEGHTSRINGLIELDDDCLLSWGDDHTLRVFSISTGRCSVTLEGHTGAVRGALYLEDRRVLSWSGDNSLRLWDYHSGVCLATLTGHMEAIEGVLLLANEQVLSWSCDNTLRLWNSQTGTCLAILAGHTDRVKGAFAFDEKQIVSWAWDQTLRLWDCLTGSCQSTFQVHEGGVKGALRVADARLLSWGGRQLQLWDTQSGDCLATLRGHTDPIADVLLLTDGNLLSWTTSQNEPQDRSLRLWDCHSGECLAVMAATKSLVRGALELSDGRLLSWSGDWWTVDNTLRLWERPSGTCVLTLEGHEGEVRGALEMPDGRLVSWSDNTIRLWDSRTGTSLRTLAVENRHLITGVHVLNSGQLVSWSEDGNLRLWDYRAIGNFSPLDRHTDLRTTFDVVRGVLALPGGRVLSWSSQQMRLWDGETEACLSTTYFEPVHGVDVANNLANGRVLSWTGTNLRLWDSQSGECFATLEGHAKDVLGVVVLTNERILSWAWKELRLWDSHYGKCLATMDGHTDYVDGALELIDGRVLSWSRDHTLRLWDSQTGACLVTLTGHNACVNGSLVLLDGRLLSWSNDKTMRLWTSQGDACLMVFQGHNTYIDGAQELADGRLCSWAGDEIRLWDTQTGVCLAAFEGVGPVLDLADGRLLSRRRNTFYLLDAQGACVSHIPTSDLVCRHPDWALAYARSTGPANVVGRCYLTSSDRIAVLRHAASTIGLSCWNAEEAANVHCLLPDGTAIATQISGQVCVLKLYLGQNRISLAEAESLLGLGMENGQ